MNSLEDMGRMIKMDAIFRKSENIVSRKIGDECILVPVVASVADVESIFSLNETGGVVWDLIDGKRSLRDIVAIIDEEFETVGQDVEADLISLIQEMIEAKLIGA